MVKKPGLGRGLSNLLPGGDDDSAVTIQGNPDYQELALDEIIPNPQQPRKRFTEQELEELAKTLQSVGLIEPVVVRKSGEKFELISGERRWRAAKLAGLKKIPAVLKHVDAIQAMEMAIIENIQREELTPIEEARAYEHWMKETGLKPADVADRVGKDRSTVTNLIRLLKLPDEVLQLVETKQISAGQARPLLAVGDRRMCLQLASKIVREGWSARKVEDEVSRIQEPGPTAGGTVKTKIDPNIRNMEDKIRSRLMTKVKLAHKKNGDGSLTIHYASLDELDRIMDVLGVKLK